MDRIWTPAAIAAAALIGAPAAAQVDASACPIDAPQCVVEHYYAAIERGAYPIAYHLWADGGRASGKPLWRFRRGFAHTAHSRVVIGAPRDQEGAAGSIYITVPVQVDAVLRDGSRQRFTGSYVLRRVNDVPGATAEQRRWHIATARLIPIL